MSPRQVLVGESEDWDNDWGNPNSLTVYVNKFVKYTTFEELIE